MADGSAEHYRAAVLASLPAQYWPLDDAGGSVAAHEVIVHDDAPAVGPVVFAVDDPWGNNAAARFDGASTSFTDPTRSNSSIVTLECWYRTTSTAGAGLVDGATYKTPSLNIGTDGKLYAYSYFTTDPGGAGTIKDPTPSNDGEWHHAVWTVNGPTVDQPTATAILYRDGLEVARRPDSGYIVNYSAWGFGRSGQRGFLAGDLAHVAVYLRAISADEVAAHFAAVALEPAGGCIRRAWLTMGSRRLPLEDEAAGYYCTELDLGYPEVREVSANRPDRDGTDDRTHLMGARALSANITARGGGLDVDEIGALFAPFMTPAARPELHYVLDRPGTPERFATVRASGYTWPVSGAKTREIHLGWVAPDPVMRDPTLHRVSAHSGASVTGGRPYPLLFPRAYTAGGGSATTGVIEIAGDLPVRPVLELYGPITDPVVILAVDDPDAPAPLFEIIFDAGFRVDTGRWVSIDTDARTAHDDQGASIMGEIDWAATSWPVLPIAPALTYLTLTGSSTTGVSQVQALWSDGYLT
jgi:hypothetical protein